MWYTLLGIFFLVITFLDMRDRNSDTILLFKYCHFLDLFGFSRDKQPMVFWCIISIQLAIGIGFIMQGMIPSRS